MSACVLESSNAYELIGSAKNYAKKLDIHRTQLWIDLGTTWGKGWVQLTKPGEKPGDECVSNLIYGLFIRQNAIHGLCVENTLHTCHIVHTRLLLAPDSTTDLWNAGFLHNWVLAGFLDEKTLAPPQRPHFRKKRY